MKKKKVAKSSRSDTRGKLTRAGQKPPAKEVSTKGKAPKVVVDKSAQRTVQSESSKDKGVVRTKEAGIPKYTNNDNAGVLVKQKRRST